MTCSPSKRTSAFQGGQPNRGSRKHCPSRPKTQERPHLGNQWKHRHLSRRQPCEKAAEWFGRTGQIGCFAQSQEVVRLDTGGVTASSRWLSAAIPPDSENRTRAPRQGYQKMLRGNNSGWFVVSFILSGTPAGVQMPWEMSTGGIARRASLNHRLQANIPPGYAFKMQSRTGRRCTEQSFTPRFPGYRRSGLRVPDHRLPHGSTFSGDVWSR